MPVFIGYGFEDTPLLIGGVFGRIKDHGTGANGRSGDGRVRAGIEQMSADPGEGLVRCDTRHDFDDPIDAVRRLSAGIEPAGPHAQRIQVVRPSLAQQRGQGWPQGCPLHRVRVFGPHIFFVHRPVDAIGSGVEVLEVERDRAAPGGLHVDGDSVTGPRGQNAGHARLANAQDLHGARTPPGRLRRPH